MFFVLFGGAQCLLILDFEVCHLNTVYQRTGVSPSKQTGFNYYYLLLPFLVNFLYEVRMTCNQMDSFSHL